MMTPRITRPRIARPALAALLALLPAAALAAPPAVTRCEADRASAEFLVEPWESHSAVYANGAIRVALIDTVEPAAAPAHLLILSPPLDEVQMRACHLVSLEKGSGFYSLDFARRKASYDPARGLTLTVPAETFVPETGRGTPATLTVTIDQRSGKIGAALK